jgi:hypothetical protein
MKQRSLTSKEANYNIRPGTLADLENHAWRIRGGKD